MTQALSSSPTESSHHLETALDAVFSWNYTSEIESLRALYAKGIDRQWSGMQRLPWNTPIDHAAFAGGFTMGGFPVMETDFWKSLSPETQWNVARKNMAFMLSNFLHGEQGALMVAAQLVNAVPDMDGKFYAATQCIDEARHVEVFSKYIETLDQIYPIAEPIQALLDSTLGGNDWMRKCVGMQIVVEGLALYSFRDMRNATREPLLRELLTYVGQDEARHTAFGIKYLGQVVPRLSPKELGKLEDFAFEASRMMLDSRQGPSMYAAVLDLWKEEGFEPADVLGAFAKERDKMAQVVARAGGRRGPVSGFVVPTLQAVGLCSERIVGHFREMFQSLGAVTNPMDHIIGLPEDLELWVDAQS